jgi:hypothetical protein
MGPLILGLLPVLCAHLLGLLTPSDHRWVSYHGVSINLSNDLRCFNPSGPNLPSDTGQLNSLLLLVAIYYAPSFFLSEEEGMDAITRIKATAAGHSIALLRSFPTPLSSCLRSICGTEAAVTITA